MIKKSLAVAMMAIGCVSAQAQSQTQLEKIASTISPANLKEKLVVIASADMEGRETATRGQRKAAAYITDYFKKLGLESGTPNNVYQMYYPVYRDSLGNCAFSINNKSLELGKDYSISGRYMYTGNWSATDFVYAGYGFKNETTNDFKDLNLQNKWVLLLAGVPADSKMTPYNIYHANDHKIANAMAAGAAGVILVDRKMDTSILEDRLGRMYNKERKSKGSPVVFVSPTVASSLLNTKDTSMLTLASAAKQDYNIPLSFQSEKTTQHLQSSNVLGILRGSEEPGQYVFVTGHYDHLGKKGNVIWYGADDDGSGTTSVLQIAKAFVDAKKKGFTPKRSIVFMTVSGEEKGLWGSEYFSDHPTVPMDSISVDLNVDMDGRVDTERKLADTLNYIYVIGHDKLSSDLQKINEAANNKFTHLTLDYKFDDPKDPNRIYYRSDHYNFAKRGVPVLFFYDGMLLADYHQPTDTVDKINFDLMSKRAKMIFYTAWDMANKKEMLVRDIPLN